MEERHSRDTKTLAGRPRESGLALTYQAFASVFKRALKGFRLFHPNCRLNLGKQSEQVVITGG